MRAIHAVVQPRPRRKDNHMTNTQPENPTYTEMDDATVTMDSRLCQEGYTLTTVLVPDHDIISVDLVTPDSTLLARINAFTDGDGGGDVDVILNTECPDNAPSLHGTFLHWPYRGAHTVRTEVPISTNVYAIDIRPIKDSK